MKNVVFDFGGVLFRWRPHALVRNVLPHRAADDATARTLAARIFCETWGEFDRGAIEPDGLVQRLAQSAGLTADEVRAVVDGVVNELEPQVETMALLERLHAHGHRLYFLSNMPEPYIAHVQQAGGFFGRFIDGVFSARVRLIKPEAAIYQHAQRQFGLDPAETVFIDDMPANVAAAQAQGWRGVRFVDAAQCETELRALGCLSGDLITS